MPGATFTLNGQYSGYEKTSPFSMKIAIENLSLQGDKDVSGDLKENVDFIRRRFDPRGKGDVTMTYSRGDDVRLQNPNLLHSLTVIFDFDF